MLGDWAEQDPKRYVDGASLSLAMNANPVNKKDHSGNDPNLADLGEGGTSFNGAVNPTTNHGSTIVGPINVSFGGEAVAGVGGGFYLTYVSDKCGNWALLFQPSTRVGWGTGWGASTGSEVDNILDVFDPSIDVSAYAGNYAGGWNFSTVDGSASSNVGFFGGPGDFGVTVGYNYVPVVLAGDFSHICPKKCPASPSSDYPSTLPNATASDFLQPLICQC